HPLRCAR
ncbi:hypothetical protein BN1723_019817, partial [Verticillium longisporum]